MTSKPVGCGAFKKFDKDTAVELKRMYVKFASETRGSGTAQAILQDSLEAMGIRKRF